MSYKKLNEEAYIKAMKEIHADLTKRFDLEDWRTVRNEFYWLADKMSIQEGLVHKIRCIEHYNNKGFPLTELIDEL